MLAEIEHRLRSFLLFDFDADEIHGYRLCSVKRCIRDGNRQAARFVIATTAAATAVQNQAGCNYQKYGWSQMHVYTDQIVRLVGIRRFNAYFVRYLA
jgi:hypothetical protein